MKIEMKVTILIYVLCQWYMSSSDAVAIEPSTFGNILASTGRFTNTIKVSDIAIFILAVWTFLSQIFGEFIG